MAFLAGRLTFLKPDLTPDKFNGGAPSMLLAFGDEAAQRIVSAIEREAFDALAFTKVDKAATYVKHFFLGRAIQAVADQLDVMQSTQRDMSLPFLCEGHIVSEFSRFANAEVVDRCLAAIARERAKPPNERRYSLLQKWTSELERAGGVNTAIPGTYANEAFDAR